MPESLNVLIVNGSLFVSEATSVQITIPPTSIVVSASECTKASEG